MSRKVTLEVKTDVVCRDRDVRLASVIERLSGGAGTYCNVSMRALAGELGTSSATARRAVASSVEQGLIERRVNIDVGCGTCCENGYRLTARGSQVLASAREAGII